MPKIYFIEYKETIVLLQEGVRFEIVKNPYTIASLNRLENHFNFINLLGGM